jgi:hypothetical protein
VIDRSGDPEELVGPEEFARILGWSGGRTTVTSRLTMQRQARLYRAAHPAAAALAGVTPRRPKLATELEELPARDRTLILQTVAQHLCERRPGDLDFAGALGAAGYEVGQAVVDAAVAELARPGYTKQPRRELMPDPDEDTLLGTRKHRYRWKRATAWAFAEGNRQTARTPARYTAQQVAAAREAVKAAADGGPAVDSAVLAQLVGLPTDAGKLEPARTLLAQVLAALLLAKQVDLRTRAQIAADFHLTANQVLVALRPTPARPSPPQPAVTCSRVLYYRGYEVDRHFAAA